MSGTTVPSGGLIGVGFFGTEGIFGGGFTTGFFGGLGSGLGGCIGGLIGVSPEDDAGGLGASFCFSILIASGDPMYVCFTTNLHAL